MPSWAQLTFVLVLAASSALGQHSKILTAEIPFDFAVGNREFPAGSYVMTLGAAPGVALLKSEDHTKVLFFITGSARSRQVREKNVLVFNRYDDRYFLSQVWTAGTDYGLQVFQGKTERLLAQGKSAPGQAIVTVSAAGTPSGGGASRNKK